MWIKSKWTIPIDKAAASTKEASCTPTILTDILQPLTKKEKILLSGMFQKELNWIDENQLFQLYQPLYILVCLIISYYVFYEN